MKIIIVILIFLLSSISFAEDVSVRFGKLKISESVGPTSYRFAFVDTGLLSSRLSRPGMSAGGSQCLKFMAIHMKLKCTLMFV